MLVVVDRSSLSVHWHMPGKGNVPWAMLALEAIAWEACGCRLGKVSNKVPSPCRSLEPLDPEGPSPPVLSTFLPPVPSTSLDPPEHFPLRKTGKTWVITASPSQPACRGWLELRIGVSWPHKATLALSPSAVGLGPTSLSAHSI